MGDQMLCVNTLHLWQTTSEQRVGEAEFTWLVLAYSLVAPYRVQLPEYSCRDFMFALKKVSRLIGKYPQSYGYTKREMDHRCLFIN